MRPDSLSASLTLAPVTTSPTTLTASCIACGDINNRGQTTVSSLLESFRRQPLGNGAYLHLGKPDEEEVVITVTGVPEVGMAGINVLLAG